MTGRSLKRILLSPPHLSGFEEGFVRDALASNWIAPLGPQVDAFEQEFAAAVGVPYALATCSGTASLHLATQLAGVQPGDEVLVSTLTFVASVNPILYCGGTPVFIDSEQRSWNMDPALLATTLQVRAAAGRLPKAIILVHLYGQSADLDAILAICTEYGVTVIEDAAEALGATYHGKSPGAFGTTGVFSFNGNKIITTSGGGMLVSDDGDLIARARKLATQAREPVAHYEHCEVGNNYRMSNILAALGRGQLRVLGDRVAARRRNFQFYQNALADLPGLALMPEADWGKHTRWLTCLTIDPEYFGSDRDAILARLESHNIEARPLWKPMHLQPIFQNHEVVGGHVAEDLFTRGLCLPSGSSLTPTDLERIVGVVRDCASTC